jgi:uncharacterized DUF497 family protein
MIEFSWDPSKAKSNKNKHGITFEEAKTVFYDPNARIIDDLEHSGEEERFIMIGLSNTVRTLVVCHCYKETESHIRIISARKATKKETKSYEEFLS